jgi:hypothetical protein
LAPPDISSKKYETETSNTFAICCRRLAPVGPLLVFLELHQRKCPKR